MPLLALMRQGVVLSLGWVVCAALALRHHGFGWALLLLVAWALLLMRFHRSAIAHARAVAGREDAA
ncbi:hypothetical protein ACI6QG_07010 [Roseococcus sp. DSY-14]|uniref:hypothetical protein n=1 Tax=Roseococcus sp. DSY-14 TaxID=3369650 RepID=UPI00387B41BA